MLTTFLLLETTLELLCACLQLGLCDVSSRLDYGYLCFELILSCDTICSALITFTRYIPDLLSMLEARYPFLIKLSVDLVGVPVAPLTTGFLFYQVTQSLSVFTQQTHSQVNSQTSSLAATSSRRCFLWVAWNLISQPDSSLSCPPYPLQTASDRTSHAEEHTLA